MTRLQTQGLHAAYDQDPVLQGIDLDVPSGTTLAVLGPSGSGKSTLLNVLAGFHRPTQGRVLADGHDMTAEPAERRSAVLIHQQDTLFPHLTVAQNVAFGLRYHEPDKARHAERVHHALELVRLRRLADRRPDQLSGGQRQRVMLARALAVRPRMLLFDEPLSALDRNLRTELRDDLRRLLDRLGITSVFVTHDQDEAALMGDLLLLLDEGRVVDHGPTPRVLRDPATAQAARLLGRRNLIDYRRTTEGLETPIGTLPDPGQGPDAGTAMLREEQLRLTDDRGLAARVAQARTVRGRHLITLEIRGRSVYVERPWDEAPPEGPTAHLLVAPEAVRCLPPAKAL